MMEAGWLESPKLPHLCLPLALSTHPSLLWFSLIEQGLPVLERQIAQEQTPFVSDVAVAVVQTQNCSPSGSLLIVYPVLFPTPLVSWLVLLHVVLTIVSVLAPFLDATAELSAPDSLDGSFPSHIAESVWKSLLGQIVENHRPLLDSPCILVASERLRQEELVYLASMNWTRLTRRDSIVFTLVNFS